jgi:hypothetical protein
MGSSTAGYWAVCPAVVGEDMPHPASWSGLSVDADLMHQRQIQKIIVSNAKCKLTSKI